MEYQLNLQKIGVMIHRYRLRRLHTSGRADFRQDGFLSSSSRHPFFDIQPGYPVCSRATLLKLENGREIREEELYRFFLDKLHLAYAYSPTREKRYKACFETFDTLVTQGLLVELERLVLPLRSSDNLLYDFYDRLLASLYAFYTDASYPSIDRMTEFSELWFCVPTVLKPITEILILCAYDTHPFFDRIDLHPLLRTFPSHPLEILACSCVAAAQERFLLSARLTERFDKSGCSGELPRFLLDLITSYTTSVLGHADHRNLSVIDTQHHPLLILGWQTLVFRLGKRAMEHDLSASATYYFGLLENQAAPLGIYAALILNRPYIGIAPLNPKLKCLVDYLDAKMTKRSAERLVMLMTQVLPSLSEQDGFIRIFLRGDVLALVQRTHRYKPAYVYLRRLDPAHKS